MISRRARDSFARGTNAQIVPTQERVVREGAEMGREEKYFLGASDGRREKRDAKKQVAPGGGVVCHRSIDRRTHRTGRARRGEGLFDLRLAIYD